MLVRKIKKWPQDPVKLRLIIFKMKEQRRKKLEQIEATKQSLLQEFNNDRLLDSLQLTEDNFPTIF